MCRHLKKWNTFLFYVGFFVLQGVGCSSNESKHSVEQANAEHFMGEFVAPGDLNQPAYVAQNDILRHMPTLDEKIPIQGLGWQPNGVSEALRGSRAVVHAKKDTLVEISLIPSRARGWVLERNLLYEEHGPMIEAAVLRNAPLYREPYDDAEMSETLPRGTLLVVLFRGDVFFKAHLPDGRKLWLHNEDLNTDSAEIGCAKAMNDIHRFASMQNWSAIGALLAEVEEDFSYANLYQDTMALGTLYHVAKNPMKGTLPMLRPE